MKANPRLQQPQSQLPQHAAAATTAAAACQLYHSSSLPTLPQQQHSFVILRDPSRLYAIPRDLPRDPRSHAILRDPRTRDRQNSRVVSRSVLRGADARRVQ
eukprot:gene12878-biopygen3366